LLFYVLELLIDDTLQNIDASVSLLGIAIGVPSLIVMGPIVAAAFQAVIRSAPFAFGSEGFVASSTIRAQPSQLPYWHNESLKYVNYQPNKRIPGYRHSFFYSDENVIADVAAWIRSGGVVTPPPVKRAVGKPSALALFIAQWFIPALTSLAMVVSYILIATNKMDRLKSMKFNRAESVTSIKNAGPPVLEFDEVFTKKPKYLGLAPPVVREAALKVPNNGICTVEGTIMFSNWNTSFEINIHGFRMLSTSEMKDEYYQRNSVEYGGKRVADAHQDIWSWNSSRGKQVDFLRQFRNQLSNLPSKLTIHVWNSSPNPARVVSKLYAQCSQ
jgi:hypothetical protein